MKRASVDTIVQAIQRLACNQSRVLVGIAGPPGAGKSTIASSLASRLGRDVAVLPMDGYHLDNGTLQERGLLLRKGAPQTFDADGFVTLVQTLRQTASVSYPTFDREADRTVPDGGQIDSDTGIVLIEGNYLLLDMAPWSDLGPLFDVTVFLDVPREVLRERLVNRWRAHGLSDVQAIARADGNDMLNIDLVLTRSRQADFCVAEEGQNRLTPSSTPKT